MHFFAWLFGRKERTSTVTAPPRQDGAVAVQESHPAPAAPKPAPPSEAENLARWKASGQARAWVEAHRGRWDHADWLGLLDELRRSPFWPLQPDGVGAVLEEHKREWLARN